MNGDPAHNLKTISLLTGMTLFNGFLFLAPEEMHMLSRGIELLTLDLLSVALTKETIFYHKLSPDENKFATDVYPFMIPKATLVKIGQTFVASRCTIPTSFLGSFENLSAHRQGMRAVDIGSYLTCIIPTLYVPQLSTSQARDAILNLVRGCQIATLWDITEDQLQEMDACFKVFLLYCNKQIEKEHLSATVFRPVVHYLMTHLSRCIANLGPLNVYSSRSQERSIGRIKTALTSKMHNQAQPSNVINRFALLPTLLTHSTNIERQANLIAPPGFGPNTWTEHPEKSNDGNFYIQLWAPFVEDVVITSTSDAKIESVICGV